MKQVTIAVLLYGDHHELHQRCLTSILQTTPADVPIRVGLNAVCEKTLKWLEDGRVTPQTLVPGTLGAGNPIHGVECDRFLFYSSRNQNIKKYPMMRRMFHDDPVTSSWVLWFDDDSYIKDPQSSWWSLITGPKFFGNKRARYIGEPWTAPYLNGQMDYVRSKSWYRGVKPHRGRDNRRQVRPRFKFHTGGFVGIRKGVIKALDWPDPDLVHNGGDTLLGEAVRQQGWPITPFPTRENGIVVNGAPRRGYREKPAGSRMNVLR